MLVSPDGERLFVAVFEEILLLDVASGKEVRRFPVADHLARLRVLEALSRLGTTSEPAVATLTRALRDEERSRVKAAEVLGLSKAGAGSRYLRAIKRLRAILDQIPGFEAF